MAPKICVLAFLLGLISNANAFTNEDFLALQGGKAPLVTWAEFKPLEDAMVKCVQQGAIETATCQEVVRATSSQLVDAFAQAFIVNDIAQKKFCDPHAVALVSANDHQGIALYSSILIQERMTYGAALYGPSLPKVYLARILADALIAEKPCT